MYSFWGKKKKNEVLINAAKEGHTDTVITLLAKGAHVNAIDNGSIWIPGSYLTINSISECKRAFPRFLTLWMNSKKPIYNGNFS